MKCIIYLKRDFIKYYKYFERVTSRVAYGCNIYFAEYSESLCTYKTAVIYTARSESTDSSANYFVSHPLKCIFSTKT